MSTRTERVREGLERTPTEVIDGLRAAGQRAAKAGTWAMPRSMEKFSTLEAAMLQAIHDVGLPEPVAEHRFVPACCAHVKRQHKAGGLCLLCAAIDVRSQPGLGRVQWRLARHEYDAGRRWRFDFAYPDRKIAIECEGGAFSGGRHTRGAGFEKDAEKYSEAAVRGWTVLRFTASQIESGAAVALVERALGAS